MNRPSPEPQPRASEPRRILIVEEALHTLKGHWYEYVKTITNACQQAGDEVTVVAHREADPVILKTLNARPLLSDSVWGRSRDHENVLKRYAGAIKHNVSLYRTLDQLFQEGGKWDVVLAPTLLIHHLWAWTMLAHKYQSQKFNRLVLIFINGQGHYQGAGEPLIFPKNFKTFLFRFLLQRLRPLVESGQVVLASETEGMAKEFTDFCGVPFQRFAHPVHFPLDPQKRKRDLNKPLRFSCLGFARHEKGSDLLQQAILEIRKRHPALRIHFIIQWLDNFTSPDGSLVARHPQLIADPDVTFLDQAFDAETYQQQLLETDAMILPYRAHSYYARVSRVAIEAAITGIPLVYTRQTWLEEMVSNCGAGIGFENENLEDLVAAILKMNDQIEELRNEALERSERARNLHAPCNYRASLMGESVWTTRVACPTPEKVSPFGNT